MTWDVYAVRAPAGARRLEDLPDGYRPPLLGSNDAVVDTIRAVARTVDSTDPTWLVLTGEDHAIEVSLGKSAQVHDLTFYVRGGDGAVPVILDVCRRLAATPYDTESGNVVTAGFQPPPPPTAAEEAPTRRWWQVWSR